MSESVRRILEKSSFKLSNLLNYLEITGWKKTDHPNPNIVLFSYVVNKQAVKAVIPKNEQLMDYNERLVDAIKIISAVEERNESAVIKSIIKMHKDIFNVRLYKDSLIDSISYNDAQKIVNSLKKLIQYSASSEQEHRTFFDKPLANGDIFIQNCQFGHTFHGSFGFTIECPELANNNCQDDYMSTSIRKVLERVIKGLYDVKIGSRDKNIIIANSKDGLNANMCEALLEIVEELKIDVEYSVDWAMVCKVSDNSIFKSPVSLGRDDVDSLNFMKNQLIPNEHEQVLVIGKVIGLRADTIYDTNQKKSPHTIKIETIYQNRKIKLSLELNAKDYLDACEAHMKERLIEVKGQLETVASKYSIVNPHLFKLSNERSVKIIQLSGKNEISKQQKNLSDWN